MFILLNPKIRQLLKNWGLRKALYCPPEACLANVSAWPLLHGVEAAVPRAHPAFSLPSLPWEPEHLPSCGILLKEGWKGSGCRGGLHSRPAALPCTPEWHLLCCWQCSRHLVASPGWGSGVANRWSNSSTWLANLLLGRAGVMWHPRNPSRFQPEVHHSPAHARPQQLLQSFHLLAFCVCHWKSTLAEDNRMQDQTHNSLA